MTVTHPCSPVPRDQKNIIVASSRKRGACKASKFEHTQNQHTTAQWFANSFLSTEHWSNQKCPPLTYVKTKRNKNKSSSEDTQQRHHILRTLFIATSPTAHQFQKQSSACSSNRTESFYFRPLRCFFFFSTFFLASTVYGNFSHFITQAPSPPPHDCLLFSRQLSTACTCSLLSFFDSCSRRLIF